MKKVIVSIDDTDMRGTPGTGKLLERISGRVREKDLGKPGFISRHQLLIHPDVPFTSHNSSMAVEIENVPSMDALRSLFLKEVADLSAQGSDPGVGICEIDKLSADDAGILIEFGRDAKKKIMTKNDAYSTARRAGVFLQELGGTGGGVIGALAGLGLRFYGNDGRVKGKFSIESRNNRTTVEDLLRSRWIDDIRISGQKPFSESDIVFISGQMKTVMADGIRVLPLCESGSEDSRWRTLTKEEIKRQF